MFVFPYIWAMFVGALNATAKVDGVIGLAIAALTVLTGFANAPDPSFQDVLWWLALAGLLWFAFEFLVLTPARVWDRHRTAKRNAANVVFEPGSVTGGTIQIYQMPDGPPVIRRGPSLIDLPDDDPYDTDTEGPAQ